MISNFKSLIIGFKKKCVSNYEKYSFKNENKKFRMSALYKDKEDKTFQIAK